MILQNLVRGNGWSHFLCFSRQHTMVGTSLMFYNLHPLCRKKNSSPSLLHPSVSPHQDCSYWGQCTLFLPLIVQHGCSVCVWLLRLRKNIEVVHAYCIDGSIRSTRISIQNQNTKEKMLTCVGWCCTFILPFNALSDQLATSLVPILASSFAYFYIPHRFLLQLASGYNFRYKDTTTRALQHSSDCTYHFCPYLSFSSLLPCLSRLS